MNSTDSRGWMWEMANSMVHWNGNQLCAIDIETTGTIPWFHEIIQIAILPLDSNLEPRKDIFPFDIKIAPNHPKRVDREAIKVNKINFAKLMKDGFDSDKSIDLLLEWVKKLKLPCTKYGTPKRIIPLGHNFLFDSYFIKYWLQPTQYNEIFDGRYNDTMIIANFLNNKAAVHAEKVPFPKVNLRYMCSKLNISYERGHDALQDCIMTAKVFKILVESGLYAVATI